MAKQALIDSVVGYARRFDAAVCAEGIESLDDLLTLADLDVTYGQGYALARPGPPWAGVALAAVEACSSSLTAALRRGGVASGPSPENADHRLEALARAVFDAGEPVDMDEAMRLVAAELHADEVYLSCAHELGGHLETVSRYGRDLAGARFAPSDFPAHSEGARHKAAGAGAGQRPPGRPRGGRAHASGGQALAPDAADLPLGLGLGLLEAYSREERPWSRTEIHRARG